MNERHDRPSQEKKTIINTNQNNNRNSISNNRGQLDSIFNNLFRANAEKRSSKANRCSNNEEEGVATTKQPSTNSQIDHFQELRKLIEYSLKEKRTQSEERLITIGDREDNIELSLELEIDDSLRNLLLEERPKGLDHLLNVTLIQETPSQEKTTLALGIGEVSQLLEMVNKSKQIKTDKKFDNEFAINNGNNTTSDSDDYPSLSQNATVYTSPQHTFDQIRRKFPCQATRESMEDQKPGTPCLCQHCGMVGLLVESQKRPAIPHSPNPKFAAPGARVQQHKERRRIVDLRTKSKSETNLILLKELNHKITTMEERLNDQEEQSVKKDYFKFVIHKLLTQYSNKINELKNVSAYHGSIKSTVATQYSRRNVTAAQNTTSCRPFRSTENSSRPVTSDMPRNRHIGHRSGVNVMKKISSSDFLMPHEIGANVRSSRTPKKVSTSVRPSKEVPQMKSKPCRKVQRSINNARLYYQHDSTPSADDYREIYVGGNFDNGNMFKEQKQKNLNEKLEKEMSAHAVKNVCDMVYSKYYGRNYNGDDELPSRPVKEIPEKLLKCSSVKNRSTAAAQQKRPNRMDVAYVSPATKNWHEDEASEQEFVSSISSPKQRNSPNNSVDPVGEKFKIHKHTIEEKIQYLRALATRKNVDEGELWTNILNQAKRHIKSNEDTVSIQLPGALKDRGMSELELTLSNLKDIVKKTKNVKKDPSALSIELEYRTSSDNYIKSPNR